MTKEQQSNEFPFENEQALVDAGWQRRFVTDKTRAQEAIMIFSELGFDVHICQPTPANFEQKCSSCSSAHCTELFLILTRKQSEGAELDSYTEMS